MIRVAVAVTRRAQQHRRLRTAGAVLTRNLWRNCAPAYKFYCQDAIEREENAELVAIIWGHYRGRVGRAVRAGHRDTLPPAAAAPRAGDSGLQPGLRLLQLQITRSKYIIMGGWSHAAPRTYCKNSVFVFYVHK